MYSGVVLVILSYGGVQHFRLGGEGIVLCKGKLRYSGFAQITNRQSVFVFAKLFFRTVNDPSAVNMYGLSHSSSTLNAKPIELLKRLGFSARSQYTIIASQPKQVKPNTLLSVSLSFSNIQHKGEFSAYRAVGQDTAKQL